MRHGLAPHKVFAEGQRIFMRDDADALRDELQAGECLPHLVACLVHRVVKSKHDVLKYWAINHVNSGFATMDQP